MKKKYGFLLLVWGIVIVFFCSAILSLKLLPIIKVYANETSGHNVKLKMYNVNLKDCSNTINPRIKLYNTGTSDIELSKVEIKYYYTIEGEINQNFWCDWSSKGSSMVNGTFVHLSNSNETADYCLNISFEEEAGLLAPDEIVELHLRIAKTDWSDYTQSNDYRGERYI